MDIRNCTRDAKFVKKYLKEESDGSIVFTKEASIFLPKKWTESDLVDIGDVVTMVGVFAILIGSKYAVININSLMLTDPSKISYEMINSVEYIKLNYLEGDRFLLNKSLVKRDIIPYKIFVFIFDKGLIPWYLNYEDISQIYDTAKDFANVSFNLPHSVFEIVTSAMARNEGAKNTYYRHGDWDKQPVYIPMRSVQFAASNTTAKLIGAYWSEGLSSALVYPSDRKEVIEELLRS